MFYLFRNQIKLKGSLAFLSLCIILVTSQVGFFELAFAIFGSYLIIYTGYQQKVVFPNFSKNGDLSYGIYIY
ncbi:hypothetical protein Q73_13435, partial [Bacillus coahuilensis m2-6]